MISYQHRLASTKTIGIGALVFRKTHQDDAMRPKLAPRFDGPYRVLETKNNKAHIKCVQSGNLSWMHFDRLKLAHDHYSLDESN